ncbi:glycosyl hydrolase, partial [Amorphoplanes nipponensis]
VTVVDDQPVDCSRVTVTYILGHAQHGHPLSTATGCAGSIPTFLDGGHTGAEGLTAVFVASYTDSGAPPQSGSDEVVLTPSAG